MDLSSIFNTLKKKKEEEEEEEEEKKRKEKKRKEKKRKEKTSDGCTHIKNAFTVCDIVCRCTCIIFS